MVLCGQLRFLCPAGSESWRPVSAVNSVHTSAGAGTAFGTGIGRGAGVGASCAVVAVPSSRRSILLARLAVSYPGSRSGQPPPEIFSLYHWLLTSASRGPPPGAAATWRKDLHAEHGATRVDAAWSTMLKLSPAFCRY